MKPEIKTTSEIEKRANEIEGKLWADYEEKRWVALDDVDYFYIRKSELAKILKEKIPDDALLWDLYETIGIWEKIIDDLDKNG